MAVMPYPHNNQLFIPVILTITNSIIIELIGSNSVHLAAAAAPRKAATIATSRTPAGNGISKRNASLGRPEHVGPRLTSLQFPQELADKYKSPAAEMDNKVFNYMILGTTGSAMLTMGKESI